MTNDLSGGEHNEMTSSKYQKEKKIMHSVFKENRNESRVDLFQMNQC